MAGAHVRQRAACEGMQDSCKPAVQISGYVRVTGREERVREDDEG